MHVSTITIENNNIAVLLFTHEYNKYFEFNTEAAIEYLKRGIYHVSFAGTFI